MTQPLKESQKIQSLEGLRGVMAYWVTLGHLLQTFDWRLPILNRDLLAVDVFMALSGFVIARLIDLRREPYGAYITRRALRIFPLYLLVLAICAPTVWVQLKAVEGFPLGQSMNGFRLMYAKAAMADMPAHLAAHIPLAQGLVPEAWLPGTDFTIVGQAWSVTLEWQFYLLAPLLMWALSRRRWPLAALAAAALVLLSQFFEVGFLGAKITQFLVGMCSYLALSRPAERRFWLIAVLALAVAQVAREGMLQVIPLTIWAVALLSTLAPPGLLRLPARMLSARLTIHFGEMAYSLYLVHMIPLYLSLYVLRTLGWTGTPLQAGVTVVTLAGGYLLARATYYGVEKPGIALGARLTRRGP